MTDLRSRHETHVVVRSVKQEELGRVVVRCWPGREAISALFGEQRAIGMAAWDDDRCVGQLSCYGVMLPSGDHLPWTTYARLGFEGAALEETDVELPGWARGDAPPNYVMLCRQRYQPGAHPSISANA